MATFAVDGLASGLDTTSIINQLVSLERQPAVRLEGRIASNTRAITALNGLSTRFDSLLERAEELSVKASTFVPVIASSSHDSVIPTAEAGATKGSFSFTVDALAASHRLVSGGTTAAVGDVVATAGTTVRFTVGGTDYDVATGDGTLQTLITNINATAGLALNAQAVNTGNGLKLQIAATDSGAAGVFTMDPANLDAAFAAGMPVLTQGSDARITVGDGPGAYQVVSGSNTFTDVIDGVTFTVTEANPFESITVSIDGDHDALVDRVQGFVDGVNDLLRTMDTHLNNGLEGPKGPLSGDSSIRSLRTDLLNAVTFAVGGTYFSSGGLIGVESTRDGTLSFDETAFRKALTERPADVVAIFRSDDAANPGIAQRVKALADGVTTFNTGLLDRLVDSREDANRGLQDAIDAIDLRVELRRTSLQRQFSALEVALSGMQAQQQWLSGALAGLPRYGSSSSS